MEIHIYTGWQPATRYHFAFKWIENSPYKRILCRCCFRMRQARFAEVYGDIKKARCIAGKGCRRSEAPEPNESR
jgi:hypothetical protein